MKTLKSYPFIKIRSFCILIVSLLFQAELKAQDLRLYQVILYEDSINFLEPFISLSDSHMLSDHPDSLAIPNLEDTDQDAAQLLTIEGEYRKRFLSQTGISESDHVFIYDYEVDKEISFKVQDLEVAALLNVYAGPDDWPYSQYDYQFGFRPAKKELQKLSQFYYKTFVSIGRKNPFVKGKLKPMIWEQSQLNELSDLEMAMAMDSLIMIHIDDMEKGYSTSGNVYCSKTKEYTSYLVDFKTPDELAGRYLVVVNAQTRAILCEKVYMESEGTSLAPLNSIETEESDFFYEQWTGKVFKNKPPVVFGFEYYSFSCPGISFLEKSEPDLYINCDNRH